MGKESASPWNKSYHRQAGRERVFECGFPAAGFEGDFRRECCTDLLMKGQLPVRILIADHQPAVRSAVRLLLEERLTPDVVGEAADSQELLAQLKCLRPDIILLGPDLPGWSTGDLFDAFRRLDPQPRVVILGTLPESMQAALAAGADAYVSMGDPPKRLLTAICTLSVEGPRE